MTRPAKLRSGGQTGADLGALRAGKILGYIPGETLGGWMPRNFLTELGSRPWMHEMYGMQEHSSPNYSDRTEQNVIETDLTILFGTMRAPGSRLTITCCLDHGKQYLVNPTLAELYGWNFPPGCSVNVAGNRESGNRGIEAYVCRFLVEAWGTKAQWETLPWPEPLPKLSGKAV